MKNYYCWNGIKIHTLEKDFLKLLNFIKSYTTLAESQNDQKIISSTSFRFLSVSKQNKNRKKEIVSSFSWHIKFIRFCGFLKIQSPFTRPKKALKKGKNHLHNRNTFANKSSILEKHNSIRFPCSFLPSTELLTETCRNNSKKKVVLMVFLLTHTHTHTHKDI